MEKNINETFSLLERADKELGNVVGEETMRQLRLRKDQIILSKNTLLGNEFLEQLEQIYNQHTLIYQCMGLIEEYDEDFGNIQWADARRARQLINHGKSIMADKPTIEKLHPVAVQLYNLDVSHSQISAYDQWGYLTK